MIARDWAEARRLFDEARELPREKRSRFLERACGGDDTLREEIENLLELVSSDRLGAASREVEIDDQTRPQSDARQTRLIPARLGRYVVSRELGRGSFGTVYLAFDGELERPVAIKVPRLDCVGDVDAYLEEARTAARLRHPSILPVYDVGRDGDGTPYVVMMHVDGPSLRGLTRGRLPAPERVAEILLRVAEAVHHAHTHGFVHRDLKPGNILLDADGRPYVADFGLALHERVQHEHKGDASGTPAYRAPEQVRGEADWLDGRCDIWALGVILYELLTGRPPFSGPDLDDQILFREPRPPRMIDDGIPEALERICLRCLAKAPENRYLTADVLASDLRRFLTECARGARRLSIREDEIGNAVLDARRSVTVIHTHGRVQGESTSVPEQCELGSNPYMGLAAFDEHNAHLFFGREEQVERLWESFRDVYEARTAAAPVRLVPILGPSGCGKSSLARAGLVAELARRSLPGTSRTRVVVLTPGSHPLESLASVLARAVTGDAVPAAKTREFSEEFRRVNEVGEYDGLRRVASLLPEIGDCPLVVLVDAFEEVYSLCDSPVEREAFIENLLLAASDRDRHASVVITLRSDFLGETQHHRRLNGLIAERGFIVPAMTEAQLRRAIAEPARHAGYEFDESFVDLLIQDCNGREGALPLLQFALSSIWKGLTEGTAPLETLKRIGGVGGALAGEAQRIHDSLDSHERAIARRIFLALIQLGEGTRDTRRRALLPTVIGHRDDPVQVREIMARFCAPGARLITVSAARDGTETAEVTHEALFYNWQTLRDWLDASRNDIRFQRRLDEAASHWAEEGRPTGLLWRSPDLDLLREFHRRAADDLTPVQLEFFLAADRRQRESVLSRRRRVHVYQCMAVIFGALLILIGYLGHTARQKEKLAQENEQRATANARAAERNAGRWREATEVARKRQYASQMAVLKNDLDEGRVVRVPEMLADQLPAAGEEDPRGWEWYYLQSLLHRELATIHGHTGGVNAVRWSPRGELLASGGDDDSVILWDADDRRPVRALLGHTGPVRAVAWSPEGDLLVSASDDGTLRLWDVVTGMTDVVLSGHAGAVRTVDWRRDGRYLASGGAGKRVWVWNAGTGLPETLLPVRDPIWSVAWSPDGRWLAAGHGTADDGVPEVTVWDARTWRRVHEVDDWAEEAWSVAWSPDSSSLAFGADLRKVKIFDVNEMKVAHNLAGHKGEVLAVTWNPVVGSGRFASSSRDRSIRIWDSDSTRALVAFRAHAGYVLSLDWSRDGGRLASGGADGTIKIWDASRIEDAIVARRFGNWIAAVDWHPNNHWLATADLLSVATVWDTRTGETVVRLTGHGSRIWDIAFSPDGSRLATVSIDRTVRIWLLEGTCLWTLTGHGAIVKRVAWSPDGRRVVSVSENGLAIVWDAETGREIGRRPGMEANDRLAWSPGGDRIAGIQGGGSVGLFRADLEERTDLLPLSGARSLAFGPDGETLAIGAGGLLHVWSFEKKDWLYSVPAHDRGIVRVAWSPAGDRIVTASDDGTVRVQDARSGLEVLRLYQGGDLVQAVDWSSDGTRIAAGTWGDNTVRVWDASRGYALSEEALGLELNELDRARSRADLGDLGGALEIAEAMLSMGSDRPAVLRDALRILVDLAARAEPPSVDGYLERAVDVLRRLLRLAWGHVRVIDEEGSRPPLVGFEGYHRLLDEYGLQPVSELVPRGSTWKYLDDGPYPGPDWIAPDFPDSDWPGGPAQLGYGDGDEATVIRFGGRADRKRATTHFRHRFKAVGTAEIAELGMGILHDDGVAVYLNGTEILRRNLAPDAGPGDFAESYVDGQQESTVHWISGLAPGLLVEGENVLAVEVHQSGPGSSDVSFDLSLGYSSRSDLAARVRDPENPVRLEVIRRLGQFKGATDWLVGLLVELLTDEGPDIRAAAAGALGQLAPHAAAELAVPALFDGLGDEAAVVRDACARALPRFRGDAVGAGEGLDRSLRSGRREVRAGACRVAAGLARTNAVDLDLLAERARDPDPETRYWAMVALELHGAGTRSKGVDMASREAAGAPAARARQRVVRLVSQSCREILLSFRADNTAVSERELERAADLARAALRLEPDRADLLYRLGIALWLRDRLDSALEALERANAIHTRETGQGHYEILTLLARIQQDLGHGRESRRRRQEALGIHALRYPDHVAHQLHLLGAWENFGREGELSAADFSGSRIEDREKRSGVALVLGGLKGLRELDLAGTAVDETVLVAVARLRQLERLSLRDTWISRGALERLGSLPALRALQLSGTAVDDEGLVAIRNFPGLESLWLARTPVTSRGLEHLHRLASLIWLDLEGTAIDDAALETLLNCPELRVLRVGGTCVSAEGVERFRRIRPAVRIDVEGRLISHVMSLPGVENLHPPVRSSIHALDGLTRPGVLGEDAVAFVDREHEFNGVDAAGIPSYLLGAELIRNANDQKFLSNFSLQLETTRLADIYLFIDNRVGDGSPGDPPTLGDGTMDWVAESGFEPTGDEIGVDEVPTPADAGTGPGDSVDNRASIYVLSRAVPGYHTLGPQAAQHDTNMYGVAVVGWE